jgi:anthranilate phosphoribosyltransferase
VLEALLERRDLSEAQASETLQALVAGAEPAQMAAFLVLLRAKGETAEEVAGLARAMRALSVPVQTPYDGGLGGGGRGALTFLGGAASQQAN